MQKKLIQLSPFDPPYYPLLNVLTKLAGEGYPLMGKKELKILNQKLLDFISLRDFQISDVRKNAAHSISEAELMSWLVIHEDLDKILSRDQEIIDVTGFPPYLRDLKNISANKVVYRFNSFIGLDREIIIVFQKSGSEYGLTTKFNGHFDDEQLRSLKLLDLLISDFAGHKELIKRDLLYKSFLIRNLIDNQPNLSYYFLPDEKYPATLFSFKVQNIAPHDFHERVLKHGFEIGFIKNKKGDYFFLIANFIQHSKEQIEKFVDAVNDILA